MLIEKSGDIFITLGVVLRSSWWGGLVGFLSTITAYFWLPRIVPALPLATTCRSGQYLFLWVMCMMLLRVPRGLLVDGGPHTGGGWLLLAVFASGLLGHFRHWLPAPRPQPCRGSARGSRRSCGSSGYWTCCSSFAYSSRSGKLSSCP